MTLVMRGYAADDRARFSPEEASDFEVAVAALRVMAHQPPQLVTRGGDGSGSTQATQFVSGNAATGANGVHQVK
jgi:hypothetical protein